MKRFTWSWQPQPVLLARLSEDKAVRGKHLYEEHKPDVHNLGGVGTQGCRLDEVGNNTPGRPQDGLTQPKDGLRPVPRASRRCSPREAAAHIDAWSRIFHLDESREVIMVAGYCRFSHPRHRRF
jgi:hypothetical protein